MVNVVISMQNTSPPLWNTDCFWIASWNTWAGNQSSVAFSGFADCSATFLQRDVFTVISVLKDKMRFYISWSAWKASNFFFSFLQISRNFVLSVRGSLSHPCTVRWSGRCYSESCLRTTSRTSRWWCIARSSTLMSFTPWKSSASSVMPPLRVKSISTCTA